MTKASKELGFKISEKEKVNIAISEEEQALLKLKTKQNGLRNKVTVFFSETIVADDEYKTKNSKLNPLGRGLDLEDFGQDKGKEKIRQAQNQYYRHQLF